MSGCAAPQQLVLSSMPVHMKQTMSFDEAGQDVVGIIQMPSTKSHGLALCIVPQMIMRVLSVLFPPYVIPDLSVTTGPYAPA